MTARARVETWLGAGVLAGAALFLALVWGPVWRDAGGAGGYTVIARFDSVDGLSPGADVRLAGVRVGRVLGHALDPDTWEAVVRLSVREDVSLPEDSRVTVSAMGLTGGRHLRIEPGRSLTPLAPGGELRDTRGAVSLEALVGRAIFGGDGS